MKSTSLFFIIALNIAFTINVFSQTYNCKEILTVVDITTNKGTYSSTSNYYSNFCSKTFSSYDKANSYGLSIGISLAKLPLNIGGKSKTSNWGEYQNELCHRIEKGEFISKSWDSFISKTPLSAIEAWKACMTQSNKGLSFYASINYENPTEFYLRGNYDINGYSETQSKGKITGLDRLRFEGAIIKKGTKIREEGFLIHCYRKDSTALTFGLRTTNGNITIYIPKILPQPAEEVPTPSPCKSDDILSNFNLDYPYYSGYHQFVVDMNNDGRLDIVNAGPQTVFVHLGRNDCGYSNMGERIQTIYKPRTQAVVYDGYVISFVDINSDNVLDLVFTSGANKFAHRGTISGTFEYFDTRLILK
jgi:hypothetical protein